MDNKSKALGYLVGKQIAGMRRVTKEPVAWLYNGVRLPKLPEWDKEAYPYAHIIAQEGNYYFVPQSTATPCASSGLINHGILLHDYLQATDEGWVTVNTRLNQRPIWANYDVRYNDASGELAGTVYLAASEPVPIYE